jgi:AraC-like DNA-binding protein
MDDLYLDERPSDSSFVDTIWRSQSENASTFLSCAVSQWEMVVTRHNGTTTLSVRGPETKATPAHCPANAEFFGIVFPLGTFLPHLPPGNVMDRRDANLPEATSTSFWLSGSAWQFPTYENAETFVDRLVRDGLLVRDPVVDAVLQQQLKDLSLRSVQRCFRRATGLTQCAVRQIERAREAVALLEQGIAILDIVDLAGYADQSHMTRSLKHLIGQTPAQIIGRRLPHNILSLDRNPRLANL